MQRVAIAYYLVWILFWFAQRILEILIINEEAQNPGSEVPPTLKVSLMFFNIIQAVTELSLFVYLITVICKLNKFLKSFKSGQLREKERKVVKRSKQIFLTFTLNIGLIMIADSIYTILSPYLWIYEVLSLDDWWYTYYDVTAEIFYLANTVFAIIMLYALSYF